jgi:hypothetical protein
MHFEALCAHNLCSEQEQERESERASEKESERARERASELARGREGERERDREREKEITDRSEVGHVPLDVRVVIYRAFFLFLLRNNFITKKN